MSNNPLVSILIPAYNVEEYIAATILSAVNQTWQNKEIIVVNNGSTDRTLEVAREFEAKGVRIISQNVKEHNAASTRNRAFYESRGELIKFLDADDLINPENIARQIKTLDSNFDYIASSEWGRFYKNDISTYKSNPETVWRDMDSADWLVEAWRGEPMMQCAIWLIPRKILEISGLWNEQLSLIDDFEFFTRVLLASKGIRFTPGARLYYRSGNPTSLSALMSRKGAESAYLSIDLATTSLLNAENASRTRRVSANMFQNYIYTFYPLYKDLILKAEIKVADLGGADIEMAVGPKTKFLARTFGWKFAKYMQHIAYRLGYKKLYTAFVK